MRDRIRINELQLYSSIYGSAWSSKDASDLKHAELQPVTVSIEIQHDLHDAGQLDDISHSIDYSRLSKEVRDVCGDPMSRVTSPETPYGLAQRILDFCLRGISQPVRQFIVELEFPKLILRAKSAGVKLTWRKDEKTSKRHSFILKELPVHAIVGLRPHEREEKQPVIITLRLDQAKTWDKDQHFSFSKLEKRISDFVETSAYLTIETLTHQIARECFSWLDDPTSFTVSVALSKPAAITLAQAPEIRITRTLSDFPTLKTEPSRASVSSRTFAALALGANLGDRFQNIEVALRYLEDAQTLAALDLPSEELAIVDTSFLYESEPMYVESQPLFINCACQVRTTLSPHDLLRVCKHIETTVGRVKSERFGPRAIDLDVITYGEQVVDTRAPENRNTLDNLEGQLVIPHPRMAEREFALRPLRDVIPEWVHPQLHLSIRSLLSKLMSTQASTLDKVLPFPFSPSIRPPAEHQTPATQTYWILPSSPSSSSSTQPQRRRQERRYTMATLNTTPDSFSDGGDHTSLTAALTYARQAISSGADIIDIGGYSTRPGAQDISPSEEISRVVPIIRAIRSDDNDNEELRNVLISIDTFREEVARAAIDAGANCINDVYAFSGGAECFPSFPSASVSTCVEEDVVEREVRNFRAMQALARTRNVPVILMHSRGPADKNKDYSSYSHLVNDPKLSVVEGVRYELGSKVLRATQSPTNTTQKEKENGRRGGGGVGGLRRWQIIVDPGIGFSKDIEGNLELLRNAGRLVEDGFSPPTISSLFSTKKAGEDGRTESESESESESETNSNSNPYTTPNWNLLAGYPLLIGPSRKSFLGSIISAPLLPTNRVKTQGQGQNQNQDQGQTQTQTQQRPRPAKERDFATSATIACSIQQGASIVRVHAVREMVDVVKVASRLFG